MTEDEIAQMFLDECLYNAGIIDKSPFDEDTFIKEETEE
tara:strand:- start:475 stop:591 length:117 start_codon:yes stop_codon:yes gene_type:complete